MERVGKNLSKVPGAVARANALSPEQRRAIAEKAAAARWGDKVYIATHRGNFAKEFEINLECYVLNDPAKTAVISQRSMGEAIGFSRRGSQFTVFVRSKTMDGYIGRDLRDKIENPLVFQLSGLTAGSSVTAHGYDATHFDQYFQIDHGR